VLYDDDDDDDGDDDDDDVDDNDDDDDDDDESRAPIFKLKFTAVTILQGSNFRFSYWFFVWASQQCSANVLSNKHDNK